MSTDIWKNDTISRFFSTFYSVICQISYFNSLLESWIIAKLDYVWLIYYYLISFYDISYVDMLYLYQHTKKPGQARFLKLNNV